MSVRASESGGGEVAQRLGNEKRKARRILVV